MNGAIKYRSVYCGIEDILTGAKEWHADDTDVADKYGFFFRSVSRRSFRGWERGLGVLMVLSYDYPWCLRGAGGVK